MLGDSVRRRLPASRFRRARPPRSPSGRGTRWRFWVPALLAVLALPFAIGYAVAMLVLFPAPEVQGAGIEVPSLIGLDVRRAEVRAREAGLNGVEATQLPHPTRPAGVVTAQSPLEGQRLRPGANIRLAVSTGRPRATVPDVAGFSAERATGLLVRLGFAVTEVEEENTADAGRVIRVSPVAGSERELPATVTLIVSTGPPLPLDSLFPFDTLRPFQPDTLRPPVRIDTLFSAAGNGTRTQARGVP